MGIDLHTHSSYSDGSDTPNELFENASRLRISALALTDHDSHQHLTSATEAVLDAQYYQALKALRGLLPREDRLLAAAAS